MTKTEMMVSKTFSARFLMAVMLTATACIGFLMGKIQPDLFLPLVSSACTAYFMRNDRKDIPKPEEKPNGTV